MCSSDLLPAPEPLQNAEGEPRPVGWWLLSLFIPAAQDAVDWQAGNYRLITRGGRIESPVRSGESKKLVRMVEEGSVLVAPRPLVGAAADVAPNGFPHPVYRAGYAVTVPVPLRPSEAKA